MDESAIGISTQHKPITLRVKLNPHDKAKFSPSESLFWRRQQSQVLAPEIYLVEY